MQVIIIFCLKKEPYEAPLFFKNNPTPVHLSHLDHVLERLNEQQQWQQ
jgi:hypothetical protein